MLKPEHFEFGSDRVSIAVDYKAFSLLLNIRGK